MDNVIYTKTSDDLVKIAELYNDPKPVNREERRAYKKTHKGKTWEEVHGYEK